MRPPLWLAIALNVLCMTAAVDGSLLTAAVHAAVLCLLASFGFVINDLHDRRIDAHNGRARLQTLDDLACRWLMLAAAGLAAVALMLAALVSRESLLIALGIAIALVLYTHVFRPVLLLANLAASALIIAPLWIPLVSSPRSVPLALVAMCLSAGVLALSREFMLDAKDRDGDAMGNRRTFATLFGAKAASMLSLLVLVGALPLLAPVVWPSTGLAQGSAWVLLVPVVLATMITATFAARVLMMRNTSEIDAYVRATRLAMLLYPLGLLLYV